MAMTSRLHIPHFWPSSGSLSPRPSRPSQEQQQQPASPPSLSPTTPSSVSSPSSAAVDDPFHLPPLSRSFSSAPYSLPPRSRRSSLVIAAEDDLPLFLQDAIFVHQTRAQANNPLAVTPRTLIAGRVCEHVRDATVVHAALVRAGVLAEHGRTVCMDHIQGAHLAQQVQVLAVPALKTLVKLLFFWAEEAMRLRVLQQGRDDLAAVAKAAADNKSPPVVGQEIALRIRAVEMKMAQRPSERQVEDSNDETLPAYSLESA